MLCPNCGRENDDRAMFCQICGITLVRASGSGAASAYAGLWQRFAAMLIDLVVLSAGTALLSALSLGMGSFITVIFGPWVYEAAMMSSTWRATLGKRAMGIIVTGVDGSRISFARATGRHFAKYLSGFLLLAGFIMAAFTSRKQALHDMIADTVVVNS